MTDGAGGIVRLTRDQEHRARTGFDMVQADPPAAQRLLAAVVRSRSAGPTARVIAWWGLGRLAHDGGAIDAALTLYTDAVALAVDTEQFDLAAEVRISWSVCLSARGDNAAALDQLALAEPMLRAGPLGRLRMQRGFVLASAGDREEAIAAYDAGLPLLLAAGDEIAATRLYSNRGVALVQLGRFDEALADFTRSQEMAVQLGQHLLAAGAAHNLGYLHGRLGDVPAALRGFADARAQDATLGSPGRYLGDRDIDECAVLLEAGLADEAERLAAGVVASTRSGGNVAQLAEALIMAARARLLAGDATGAAAAAQEAVALFTEAGRGAWAAFANYWLITSMAQADGAARSGVLRQFVRLRRAADQMERYRWTGEATEVRVLIGRLALVAGRFDIARSALSAASDARTHPVARVRAEAWHAAALLDLADGNRRGALRALAAGLRSVDEYRASLGAVELRATAGRLGSPLAALGLRLACEQRRASSVLEWCERWRGGAMGAPGEATERHLPPDLLSSLRRARAELIEALPQQPERVAALAAEVAGLERDVGRANRQRSGGSSGSTAFRTADLLRVLGDRTLVEYLEVDGALLAVVCHAGTTRLVEIGSAAQVAAANDHLAFSLRRMSTGAGSPLRALQAFELARNELAACVLGPVMRRCAPGPMTVVPTGALHDVFWGALPVAEQGHGLVVAPSAAWWSRAAGAPRPARVLVVAGPHLHHAAAEVTALRRLYPRAQVLAGRDATVAAVLEAMGRSTLVHVAAHGTFRMDNPMFSTLHLHDGPLHVHELEELEAVPATVVLTACSAGRSGVLPGDELLGTSAVLMALGVRTLVAPLMPVADAAAADVAVAIHSAMRRGQAPDVALGSCVRRAIAEERVDLVAAAASFTCVAARGN